MTSNLVLDDWDDLAEILPVRNMPRPAHQSPSKPRRKGDSGHKPEDIRPQLAEDLSDPLEFNFTYDASRHERQWIVNSLGPFYEQHWIDDVLRLVKGGKEAHVYQCLAHATVEGLEQPYIAAKVYRPRMFRNLKNDHVYKQGRSLLDGDGRPLHDGRIARAVAQRTAYGQSVAHTSWIEHEFKTLQLLHEAGADVPVPLESGNNAILMGYLGDADGPAPTLNSVDLDRSEARTLFQRVVHNIELMLARGRVHADLSAYNILYWEGGIALIDFPQAIDPDVNRNGFQIFERDVRRVCEYFARQGVRSDSRKLAADLWLAHGRRQGPEVHPALLDDQDEGDRAYWESLSM